MEAGGEVQELKIADKDVRWSPRVSKWKIRQLYIQASQGIYDEVLVDDVGLTLYLRCRDILIIHRAQSERLVTCPCCLREGITTHISRANERDSPILCPVCGWQTTWFAYRKTFRRGQLNPGGAVIFFQEFLRAYDLATTAKERMMAIDRVIHQFHYSLRTDPDQPTRAAGVNLIDGKLEDVVKFLNQLSELDIPAEMQQRHEEWQQKQALTYWPDILKKE